jgi:ornithine decarboxylase
LSPQYGAEVHEWEPLLAAAAQLGVAVEGVAFHVGSGATNPAAFSHAVELGRAAWDAARAHGFDMKVLDIGGGFCGGRFGADGRVDLGGVPEAVNSALDAFFPEHEGARLASPAALCVGGGGGGGPGGRASCPAPAHG